MCGCLGAKKWDGSEKLESCRSALTHCAVAGPWRSRLSRSNGSANCRAQALVQTNLDLHTHVKSAFWVHMYEYRVM